jgi:hypothetical protein
VQLRLEAEPHRLRGRVPAASNASKSLAHDFFRFPDEAPNRGPKYVKEPSDPDAPTAERRKQSERPAVRNIGINKEVGEIHVRLTRSPFAFGILRRFPQRVLPGKSISAPLRF